MSDETEIDVETPEIETEEAPAPEVDIEVEKAAIEAAKAEIAKDKKALQKGFAQQAARERAYSTPKPAETDPFADLDPQQAAWLKSTIEKVASDKVSPELQSMQQFLVSTISDQIDTIAASKGLDVGEVREVIDRYGLRPADNSISAVRDVAEMAAKLLKSESFDSDAEEKRITEKVLAQLAEKGVKVESVRPVRAEIGDSEPDWEEGGYTPEERYDWIMSHGG